MRKASGGIKSLLSLMLTNCGLWTNREGDSPPAGDQAATPKQGACCILFAGYLNDSSNQLDQRRSFKVEGERYQECFGTRVILRLTPIV